MNTILKNNKGMTLTEVLAATLIMLLVSLGLTTGVALANRQFVTSIRESEAQELYSTLSSLITNELRFTNTIYVSNNDNINQNVKGFLSYTYATNSGTNLMAVLNDDGILITDDSYGELAIGNNGTYNRLLGSASYPNNLGAKWSIIYNSSKKYFTVTLDIGIIGGNSIYESSFDVLPLNTINSIKVMHG